MKYSLYIILLLIVTTISCRSKQPEIVITPDSQKNHLQRNHLFGKVKTISTALIFYDETDSVNIKTDTLSVTIQQYNPYGYLIQTGSLNKNGDTVSKKNIYYKKDAKEEYWDEVDSSGAIISKCQYIYDMNNMLSEEKVFKNDTLFYAIQYKTDGIGNILEMTQDFKKYKVSRKMQYNLSGLVSRIDEYDPDGKLFKYITIEYNNDGNEVNRRAYRNTNNIIEYTYTQYDQSGRILKAIYEDRMHKFREVNEYSGHDTPGNWKKEIRKKNGKTVLVRSRQFEYYEPK